MKKFFTSLFLLFIVTISIFSQSCLPEGIKFHSQEEIDNFQNNYPSCVEIEGGVTIDGSDINNLNGLNAIQSIYGYLVIDNYSGHPNLTSLQGLENLESIGGTLALDKNISLTSLNGLEQLKSIGGGFIILFNNSLIDLSSLENLESIGEMLWIEFNSSLINLNGLDNVTSIGEDLILDANFSLSDISGLNSLKSIGGDIKIRSNQKLVSLHGIGNIDASTIHNMRIDNNIALTDCGMESICEYLKSPNGDVNIYNNATGCENPPEIASGCDFTMECLPYGSYFFNTQAEISNFPKEYSNCVELNGSTKINGENINNLNGLNMVTRIVNLDIIENPVLSNLTGLENLNTVDDIIIWGNENLTSLSGLEGLTSVESKIEIYGNQKLSSIEGLTNVTSLTDGSTRGVIYISSNDILTSLSGIDNIEADDILSVHFRYNPILSDCSVKSICDYLSKPDNGPNDIRGNADGCLNEANILDSCLVSIQEYARTTVGVFPNPADTKITISGIQKTSIETVKIYSHLGRLVFSNSQQNEIINISMLAQGLYFIEVTASGKIYRLKLIIE